MKRFGIAILNTDRPKILRRLLQSMNNLTPKCLLNQITVNIIDDSSKPESVQEEVKDFSFTKFHHFGNRIGVAKNTNNALYLLRDQEFSMIFNNDCEIKRSDWITFYYNASKKTNIHHFCFRQKGLWGAGTEAKPSSISNIRGVDIETITNHPQGALLAYDRKAFETVGYFDSDIFSGYGRSHWLWSFRISESGIQPPGIHDVVGSNSVFKVHNEVSVTPAEKRIDDYKRNTVIYDEALNQIKNKKRSIYKGLDNG